MINWRKLFGMAAKSSPSEIILGEKLPWPEYQKTGDYSTVVLNEDSFDVIISLCNLSEQEEYAIADEAFTVYITETEYAPFLVFKFGDVFKCDLTINLKKMNPDVVEYWFKSTSNNVTLYLLEGTTAEVRAVRMVPFMEMSALKQTCMSQFNRSKEEIDSYIHQTYNTRSVGELMSSASIRFDVPESISI